MKASKVLCLVLILLVVLPTACTPVDDPGDPDTFHSVDGPVNTSDTLEGSPFVGTFRNTYSARFASMAQDVFELEDDIPVLAIDPDGTFTLTVIDIEGARSSHSLAGTVIVTGDVAHFTPEGEDSPWFRMALLNTDEMRYLGTEFYCVCHGDIFARVNMDDAPNTTNSRRHG